MVGGAPYTQESHGGWTPPSPATGCGAISFAPPVESSPVRHLHEPRNSLRLRATKPPKRKPWQNPLTEADVVDATKPLHGGKGRLQDTQRRLVRLAYKLVAKALADQNPRRALDTAFRLIESSKPQKRRGGIQGKQDAIREVQDALARFTAQGTE